MSKKNKADTAPEAPENDKKKNSADDADGRVRESIQEHLDALMSGSSIYGEPRTAQDISDGTGISRAAIRKYQQCKKGGSSSAVPSAVALCRIADYFGVTPNFILGYPFGGDEKAEAKLRTYDSACRMTGLGGETVKQLAELRALASCSDEGRGLLAALDAIVSGAAGEFLKMLKDKS